MNSKEQETQDLLKDVVDYLVILRNMQRRTGNSIGAILTDELLDRVKVQLKKLEEV